MTRKVNADNPKEPNGKPVAADYVATITVENHVIVHATTNGAARKQIKRLIPSRFGTSRKVTIVSVERCP